MKRIRADLAFAVLCSLFLGGSCKSGDEDAATYKDNRGRVCSVDVRTDHTPADCDKQSRPVEGCSIGVPCFVLNVSLDIGEMQNCDTCCVNGLPALPDYRDCARVTCRNNEDCLYADAVCQSNFCFRKLAGGAGAPNAGTGGSAPAAAAGNAGTTPAASGAGGVFTGGGSGAAIGGAISGGPGAAGNPSVAGSTAVGGATGSGGTAGFGVGVGGAGRGGSGGAGVAGRGGTGGAGVAGRGGRVGFGM